MEETFAIFWFLYGVWSVGAASGVCRALLGRSIKRGSDYIAIAGVSGFTALACVCLFAGDFREADFGWLRFIGVAAVCGLAGQEQKLIISFLFNRAFPDLQQGDDDEE